MSRKCVGILREVKNKWERRVPLVPDQVAKLTSGGIKVLVQPSERRIFTNDEFRQAGAELTDDLSQANCIIGVKEVPVQNIIPNKSYLIFSHTIKAQPQNMPLLDACLNHHVRLFDYECIRDAEGNRLVAFGKFAGIVGMVDCFRGLGAKLLSLGYSTPFMGIASTYMYPSVEEANRAVSNMGREIARVGTPKALPPFTFVFTGAGNVTEGSLSVFKLLPHEFVTPDELRRISNDPEADRFKVYGCMIGPQDMVTSIAGTPFNKKDYYSNPQAYKPIFHEQIAPFTSVLINGMYWDAKYPRLITNDQMEKMKSPLLMVADISCDIQGSIEFLLKSTSLDEPYFIYDPITRKGFDELDGRGIMMLGVDNLPASVPREASMHFSRLLSPFIPSLASSDASLPFDSFMAPDAIKRACITSNGKLTTPFEYIGKLRKAKIVDKVEEDNSALSDKSVSVLWLKGHLFDSGLINLVLDILEDKSLSFRVLHWDIGPNQAVSKQTSSAVVEVSCKDQISIQKILESIHVLIGKLPASQANVQLLPFSTHMNYAEKIAALKKEVEVQEIPVVTAQVKHRILLLGSGFVAGPVVEYLTRFRKNEVTIASNSLEQAKNLAGAKTGIKILHLDASNIDHLSNAIEKSDIVISLLPATSHVSVANQCLKHKRHLVTASYISPEMRKMNDFVASAGLTFLNEIGLDPGIDHMSAMSIINEVQEMGGKVTAFESLCGGLPAPEAADNPLGYKFSWSPRGVLNAASNSARYKRDGKIISIAGADLLKTAVPVSIYPSLSLEQYANRDSLQYASIYGIDDADTIYRGTLRYGGFSNLLLAMSKVGLLNSLPIEAKSPAATNWKQMLAQLISSSSSSNEELVNAVNSILEKNSGLNLSERLRAISAMQWLGLFSSEKVISGSSVIDSFCSLLQDKLVYKENERDMALLHHSFDVVRADKSKERITSTLLCYGDTKFSAMARTVGYPTAIAAQSILDGTISRKGVRDPTNRDIYIPILRELKKEGIECKESIRKL